MTKPAITTEEINGQKMTVVWHTDKFRLWAHIGRDVGIDWKQGVDGCCYWFSQEPAYCIATALPALPRNPKPEDAKLLYRYMAEGIALRTIVDKKYKQSGALLFLALELESRSQIEITHATFEGERVEVAIKEKKP